MEQTERIRSMETVLQQAKTACRALDEAMERFLALEEDAEALNGEIDSELQERMHALDEAMECFQAMEEDVDMLSAYYGSELWFFDLDCDRAGLLPRDLPRGVLSEDEAYDLLCDWRELQSRASALFGADETPAAD